MSDYRDFEIIFDYASQDYYIIWEPPAAIGSGKTQTEALRDLRETVHFGVDTLIKSKLQETVKED
jgi:hypothetical protein